MTSSTEIIPLSGLEFIAYLDDSGKLPESLSGKIGVYAIFNQSQVLQYVGYSRDVFQSIKQHLVRQPEGCYWLKVQTINRPSKTLLEAICDGWIAENGSVPPGNAEYSDRWNQPIDVKPQMTSDEVAKFDSLDEIGKDKLLKTVAKRVEANILSALEKRGLQEEIRFNPKLKTQGILDLK